MTDSGGQSVMIPARVTVDRLAGAIGREIGEVQAVLEARGEPSAPDDLVDPENAVSVGRALGVAVGIEARDLALECLYQLDTRGEAPDSPGGRAGRLLTGIAATLDDLDAQIETVSENWSVARMPVVDRNILRIGLYELANEPDVSTAVIVSEAVRLAKTYSTERSGAFVNGVLATLSGTVRHR